MPDTNKPPCGMLTHGPRFTSAWEKETGYYIHSLESTTEDDTATAACRLANNAPLLADALRNLLTWCRDHTSPLDDNSPHLLMVDAVDALTKATGTPP